MRHVVTRQGSTLHDAKPCLVTTRNFLNVHTCVNWLTGILFQQRSRTHSALVVNKTKFSRFLWHLRVCFFKISKYCLGFFFLIWYLFLFWKMKIKSPRVQSTLYCFIRLRSLKFFSRHWLFSEFIIIQVFFRFLQFFTAMGSIKTLQ